MAEICLWRAQCYGDLRTRDSNNYGPTALLLLLSQMKQLATIL